MSAILPSERLLERGGNANRLNQRARGRVHCHGETTGNGLRQHIGTCTGSIVAIAGILGSDGVSADAEAGSIQ